MMSGIILLSITVLRALSATIFVIFLYFLRNGIAEFNDGPEPITNTGYDLIFF